jgi:hypothetical protein
MSELKFSCPHCSQHIACGLDWAGMQTKCPSCQNDIVIPKPPPAVAAAPAPGPLRVSMPSSSHAAAPPPPPPPPTRSSFPQPPAASGLSVARPAAPPPQHAPADGGHVGAPPGGGRAVAAGDSPVVQWAGLIGAFLVTAIIIGMAATWKPPAADPGFMAKLREAAKGGTATADEDEEEDPTEAAGTAKAAAGPVTPQWTLEAQGAQIPQAAASGQFGGRPFTPEKAYLQRTPTGYLLTVRQGAGFQAEREILVALPLSPGQALDGQSWNIAPNAPAAPRLVKRWLENARPRTTIFTNGYVMKLEFEQTANNQIPAKLFVALPDEDKTFVAGTMTASFLVAGTAQPQPQQRPPQQRQQPY